MTPLRVVARASALMLYFTLPLPEPLAPAVIVIHVTEELVDQVVLAVTVMVPLPPMDGKVVLVGLMLMFGAGEPS